MSGAVFKTVERPFGPLVCSTRTAFRQNTSAMIDWDRLNPEQADVVRSIDERLLVLAPVGTGKTNVLALRAANAIEEGRDPRGILCLSFTNKAAREMSTRLTQVLGDVRARKVTSRTFHGLCASILREEAPALGLDGDFLIYDEEDGRSIWGQVLEAAGVPLPRGGRERNEIEFFYFAVGQRARLTKWEDRKPRTIEQVFEEELGRNARLMLPPGATGNRFKAHLTAYMHALRGNHALDFADLIDGVNRLFDENRSARSRWQGRFAWMQVDEVQDTNRGEYRVIEQLAAAHKSLSFFGDIDQTVYEWRGSDPHSILHDYRAAFAPVREVHLVRNYRSTATILAACERVIRQLPGAVTKRIVPQSADAGEPIQFEELDNVDEEAAWIAGRIGELRRKHGLRYDDFAVLTRTNFKARDISRTFSEIGLPHVQVDEYKFFQRMEIKDALAHLRLITNPHDGQSLDRFLVRPPKGVGDATLQALRGPVRETGLKLGDLLSSETYRHGDPFAPLLEAAEQKRLIVFDLETTGTDRTRDEIIEVAARRYGTEDRFHALLRPERSVGDSVEVHGLTDEFLAREGRPAGEALDELRAFADGCVLAGHNVVSFDVPFLQLGAACHGAANWDCFAVFDTLDLARRFYRLPRYKLESLAQHFGFTVRPSHRAMDDVDATCELMAILLADLREREPARREALKKHATRLLPLAEKRERWFERARFERPHELLMRVLDESGLARFYEERKNEPARVENLKRLVRLVEQFDNPELPPREALLQSLQLAALGQDTDQFSAGEDRVAVLTVHQAKGLEFDTVFVAQACDGEFPSSRSIGEGRLDEEHRLFYVAITRARRRLFCSWSRWRDYGRKSSPSRYLAFLRDPSAR